MYGLRRPSELENMPDFLFDNAIIISDPREENCYSTIKDYCCPYFSLSSFTAIISIIQILLFTIMCIYGQFNLSGTVIQFSDQTLDTFGNCSAYMVKYKLEYYRLLTSLFIFNNIKDLCGGILFQLIIVSMSEKFVNRSYTCLIYITTGIGGTISFIVFYDQVIEGNTFCVFGIIGAICGFSIQSAQYEDARQVIMQMAIFIIIIGIIGFFYKNSFIFGFYGSFILGMIIGLIIPILQRQFQRTKLKLVGLGIIFMYFTGLIYIFFSFREPTMPIKQY